MVAIGCLSLRAEFWMHPYDMVSNAAPSSNSNQPIKQLVLRMLLFLLLLLLLILGQPPQLGDSVPLHMPFFYIAFRVPRDSLWPD